MTYVEFLNVIFAILLDTFHPIQTNLYKTKKTPLLISL